jgi:beta-lactamase superfamily II metal-dependent hydrolase
VIDVEGGQALLAVSPAGESMLVDAGWPGFDGRDASRIAAAARAAGIKQIDYLVISHYDIDHIGDLAALLVQIPVRHVIDNGPSKSTNKGIPERYKTYAEARDKLPHSVARLGETLPVRGIEVKVIAAATQPLRAPAGGGLPNKFCATSPVREPIAGDLEDNMSIGLLFTLGRFRMIDLSDMEWDVERDLMCPVNPVGKVDVYVTNVHGQSKAGSPALVYGLAPRVVLMNNGGRKGGDPPTWDILKQSPGLEDIWQAHRSDAGGEARNPPEDFIANLKTPCEAKWLKLSAAEDGSFTVLNSRNGFSKKYAAR